MRDENGSVRPGLLLECRRNLKPIEIENEQIENDDVRLKRRHFNRLLAAVDDIHVATRLGAAELQGRLRRLCNRQQLAP